MSDSQMAEGARAVGSPSHDRKEAPMSQRTNEADIAAVTEVVRA